MVCLRRLVGFTLIVLTFKANGVQTGGALLACHVPLEVKIFADSSYQALSADLKPCTHIILSSANALFLPTSNASLASILVNEKRMLELLKQQTPEAEFSFSLRSINTLLPTWNLKTIFNRTSSIALLVEFLRVNKLKSFDIAWDFIQSAPDYGPQLKSLKTTLGKEGFNLTTTIGVEIDRIDAFHVTKIASIVDRIFLVPSYNRHYSGSRYPLTEKKVEQAFDALELNEGTFLKLYSTLNLSWKKIVVGLSLKTLVWKLNFGTITSTQFSQYQAVLQLQNYYESCKTINSSWQIQQQPPNPFYQLAVAPTNDQWMIHVDPLTLGRRVDLLKQYGFGGVALYDYYQDDFAGICNPKGKIYPIIEHAGRSIRNVNTTLPFPNIDVNNGFCIPFLGLTDECKGVFNLGMPKISTKALEFTSPSTVPVTRTTFPVVNNTTPSRESSQYAAETGFTMPSSSISVTTIRLAASWTQVADAENLVRTRRSSVSSSDMGTEPSFSYLRPPGFDLVDIAPSFSSSNSELGLPAPKSSTNFTPNIVTEASKGKIDPSRDHQTYLLDAVATMVNQTLELPGTVGNQAALAIQESIQSAADIVSSKLLPWKLEIPTAVSPISTLQSGWDTFTEIEPRSVTTLQNSIENGVPVASAAPSTSKSDRMMDSTTVTTVPSSQAIITSSFQKEVEHSNKFDLQVEATTDAITYASDSVEHTVPPANSELKGETESEKNVPLGNTFSIREWNTPEETFGSETRLIHSTVLDPSSVKDHLSEHPTTTRTEDPSTTFDDVSTDKEVGSVLEESVGNSLPSQIFFSNVEPIYSTSLMVDDSTSLIPNTTETVVELSSPASSVTPIAETSFSIHLNSSTTETPMLLDASTAVTESTDRDSDTPEQDQDPLFGKSQSKMTPGIYLNENQSTEPFQEAFSDGSAVPFPTTSIDVEMTDISTRDETNLPTVSHQPTSNKKTSTMEFSPATLQMSTESSFPISDLDGISSTSIPPFIVADTSSTYLKPSIVESSTEVRYSDSSLSDLKTADGEDLSPYVSAHFTSTVADITSTENYPSSSFEPGSSADDWNSPEVYTESGLLSSTSNNVEMMNVQTVGNKEIAALSSPTSLAEKFGISKLFSISMETSTEDYFSPSSDEVSPTFEPIPLSSFENTSSTVPYNIRELSTTNSSSVPYVITTETELVDEENEFVSSTMDSIYLEDSQTNFSTDKVGSSLISFAVDGIDNVDTTLSADISEATESVPITTEENSSRAVVRQTLSSTTYASQEQTPTPSEENPSELTIEPLTTELVLVSADPSLLHSTSMEIKSSSIEGSTPIAVAGTSTDGFSLKSDEFSGISELPLNFVDTSTEFSIGPSWNSVTFDEDSQNLIAEEFQTLPISQEVTTSSIALMDKEDDRSTSKAILYFEDFQSNVPTEKTYSSDFPYDMSGSYEERLDLLETNPPLTDLPASFQFFSTSNELSGDFTSFEPSLFTTNLLEVKPLRTDFTTSDEELREDSTPTQNFENGGLEDNSFLTAEEDGSGTTGFLISTDPPQEIVSISEIGVTLSPIHLLPSSPTDAHLELDEDSFTSSFTSTQIADTKSSIISNSLSTDVTFESTSFPTAVSSVSIADASQPVTRNPPLELSTSSVLSVDYDVMVTSTMVLDNIFPEGSGDSLGSGSPLVDSFMDSFPTNPSQLDNLQVTNIPEDAEGSAFSSITYSDEQFIISKSSPSILKVSTEGASLSSDNFSGTSEPPHNLADTSTFFMPIGLSTDHLSSENSSTLSTNMQTLIEEKFSSPFLPTTFGTGLLEKEKIHVSPTSSLFFDVQSNVPSEETRSSPTPFDMPVFFGGSFEQSQTSPLVVTTDSLSTASVLPANTSGELPGDFVSVGSSTSVSSSEFQLVGADFTTPDEKVVVSTSVPNFEYEGSAENSIVILEVEGSGAITPGFLNTTVQPIQTINIISEIDSTANGVSLPFSSPATSLSDTFHTYDGTAASSVESTSARGVSLIEQELANDSFASISFSGTTAPSPLSSSSKMSMALTSTASEILSTVNPSSQMPVSVTTSAGLQSTLKSATSVPSLAPDASSSQSPIFDVVTVSLETPSAYNMEWNNPSSGSSGSLLSSSSSTYSPSTYTTELNIPSISMYSTNSFPITIGASLTPPISASSSEFLSSTTSRPATLPPFSSSTVAMSTASPDAVPSFSTNSAIMTSISPTASDIPTSTTVPPIINLWNLLIARITTANGIPLLEKNVTSSSPLSDGVTSALHSEELEGPSTSSMPRPDQNSENSAFGTRPFWLATRPSGNFPLVLSTSQTFSNKSKSTTVVIPRTTTLNAEPSVRTSTTESSTHSMADLILTRPVWIQGNTKRSKLTTNVMTTTRLSNPITSSTKALHFVTSESTPLTTTPLPTTLSTNLIVNGHPFIKNCTEHVVHSSNASVIKTAANKIIFQMNMTVDIGNQPNSSFHLDKWSKVMNQFFSSQLNAHREEIQSSSTCVAAGDSILLKSLLCSNQSHSTKGERFPNIVQFIRHLAPAIVANLTTAMNLTEIQNSVNITEFEVNHSSTTPSGKETSTESTIPISTESTTMSAFLMQRLTECLLLNLSTASFNNGPVSPFPTVLNISLGSLMENLTEQLNDTKLTDVISAVNRLSQNDPEGFFENLIQNNNSRSDVFFSQPLKFESVKEDVLTTQEHTSTTIPTTEVHDVLQKDFWKTNRRSPIKMLQRVAGAGRVIPPFIGLSWRGTMKPVSSIFRSFAKPAVIRL